MPTWRNLNWSFPTKPGIAKVFSKIAQITNSTSPRDRISRAFLAAGSVHGIVTLAAGLTGMGLFPYIIRFSPFLIIALAILLISWKKSYVVSTYSALCAAILPYLALHAVAGFFVKYDGYFAFYQNDVLSQLRRLFLSFSRDSLLINTPRNDIGLTFSDWLIDISVPIGAANLSFVYFTYILLSYILLARANSSSGNGYDEQNQELPDAERGWPKLGAAQLFVANLLRDSIVEAKNRASFVLQVIFALLVVAVLVIAFAGQITSLDLTAGSQTNPLEIERNRLDDEELDIQTAYRDIIQSQIQNYSLLSTFGVPTDFDSATGIIRADPAFILFSAHDGFVEFLNRITVGELQVLFPQLSQILADQIENPAESEDVPISTTGNTATALIGYIQATVEQALLNNSQLENMNARLEQIATRRTTILQSLDHHTTQLLEMDISSGTENTDFIAATSITRFGIVAIIVFIIQILVTLYRYNMRLASFYESRLAAFVYGKNDDDGISFFAELFNTTDIRFGRDITSPTQDIKELIQKTVEEAGKAYAARRGS